MSKKLLIDMDGTLCRFHDTNHDYVEAMWEQGFYRNLKPFDNMVEAVKNLIKKHPDVEIYIISAVLETEPPFAENEKAEWLQKYLPEINPDNYIFTVAGEKKSDYSPIDDDCYLIDDYNYNLHDFESNGGHAIKFINDINNRGLGAYGGEKGNIWQGDFVDYSIEPNELTKQIENAIEENKALTKEEFINEYEVVVDERKHPAFDNSEINRIVDILVENNLTPSDVLLSLNERADLWNIDENELKAYLLFINGNSRDIEQSSIPAGYIHTDRMIPRTMRGCSSKDYLYRDMESLTEDNIKFDLTLFYGFNKEPAFDIEGVIDMNISSITYENYFDFERKQKLVTIDNELLYCKGNDKELTISADDGIVFISHDCFFGNKNIEKVTIDEVDIPNTPFTETFAECDNLKEVVMTPEQLINCDINSAFCGSPCLKELREQKVDLLETAILVSNNSINFDVLSELAKYQSVNDIVNLLDDNMKTRLVVITKNEDGGFNENHFEPIIIEMAKQCEQSLYKQRRNDTPNEQSVDDMLLNNGTVKTNIGNIPIEDYRDIVAQQEGFDDYKDMRNSGVLLGNDYDEKPKETSKTNSIMNRLKNIKNKGER